MSEVKGAPLSKGTAQCSEHIISRVAMVLGTALASVVALSVTEARCGGIAIGAVQSRSRYCRVLNLPARPHSATSL